MAVTILIPTALRFFTDGLSEVKVEAVTVGGALELLAEKYADLKRHLYSESGELRSFVNIYLNEEDIREHNGLLTPVTEKDTVMIIPSIAGGSGRELPELTPAELTRYSRHLILPEVGYEGQQKLKGSRVLLIGTGGLGAPLSMYLAAAGVGTIGLVDFDTVDESNLQRQIVHSTRDIGRPKIASAKDRIRGINPYINIETFETKLTSANALDIIKDFDVVADGTDNFPTRYLVNDVCVILKKPNIYGSIFRFEGQASVFSTGDAPCYRCLFREPPPPGLVPSCSEGGVLGVLAGIIGCIQANETIKVLLGKGETLANRLLLFDALGMKFRELKIKKNPHCPVCGENPTITELIDYEDFCGLKQHEDEEPVGSITSFELKKLFDEDPDSVQIIDIREPHELAMGKLPNTTAVPFGQVVRRMDEISSEKTVVFVCKIGVRSVIAIRALRDAGHKGNLINLQDGMNAWARDIDSSIVKY